MKRKNRPIKPSPAANGPAASTASASTGGIADFLQTAWQRGWLFALLLVAATLLAYQPIWQAGFIWDDDGFVVANQWLKNFDGLYRIWFTTQTSDYFPMTFSSLWVDYHLWGLNPVGYHWTNLLLHTASALIWWRVLARLKIPGAKLAAAIFALHPVNVESVAWITERKNTLSMFFFAWTALGYLKFEDSGRRRWYWLAAGLFALSLLSKTAPVALPIALLAAAWWRRGRIDRRDILRSSTFFVVALVLALVTIWFQYSLVLKHDVVRQSSPLGRLAGAGWAVWFYLYKALIPLNLMFVYPRWKIDAANLLSYVPGVLFLGTLALAWFGRDRLGKGLLFGLVYFVLMLMPILGFLDNYFMRYSLVTDHWQYFAIIAPITLAVVGLDRAGKFLGRAGPSLGVAVLAGLGALTWQQCRMYQSVEALWTTTVAQNPNAFLARLNLGGLLLEHGDEDAALPHLQKAAEIEPDAMEPVCALGNVALRKGQMDEAAKQFRRALEISATFWEANYGYGTVLLQQRRPEEAVPYLEQALAGQPGDVMTANNLGIALLELKRADEAIAMLQQALEAHPRDHRLHDNLGNALMQRGRYDEGIAHIRKALELQPDFAAACHDLAYAAWLLATSPDDSVRNGPKAVELARQVVESDGARNPMYIATMAAAYAEAGKFPEAIAIAERAKAMATARGNHDLVEGLENQIQFYKSGSPIRDERLKNKPAN